ncbi:hypothetical protein [Azotobacter vinelandii]|uniref:hypothetical protein n=1 Tax=Azotobacter vinelandii TaxID=354 RepID=UPI0005A0CA5C|nr:hypothetical protein [Azotobacter vinelandii]WKN23042.1 hypothetical protein AVAEIV_001058 [Azotobacter vinelandii]SFX85141.1 hypothetical protein SAMN04244547_02988 [Azotobacter vinelandii]
MFTISTTLILALLGCALLGRRLYLNRWTRARAPYRLDGSQDDLWARQEFAAQQQAWEHLQRLERATKRRRR